MHNFKYSKGGISTAQPDRCLEPKGLLEFRESRKNFVVIFETCEYKKMCITYGDSAAIAGWFTAPISLFSFIGGIYGSDSKKGKSVDERFYAHRTAGGDRHHRRA